jgi:cyclophilin family peptidyl-prolyl cis-trans isomerase
MTTSLGLITIELDEAKAPISSRNFLEYVESGHYDGTIFHRVIADFMIQGGGFTPEMKKKPVGAPISNEWRNGLKNKRGTLAMARLGGDPDSATSQFFINVLDNGFLDREQPDGAAYAVFGRVTGGMDVVDKIRAVKTATKRGHENVPVTLVVIESATIVESK